METGDGTAYVPLKRMKKSVDGEAKNALQELNETLPGLKFEFSQTGPSHEPMFTAQVTVSDQVCCVCSRAVF